MGRFAYWMNVSLDGYIEGRRGEDGGGSWMRIDSVVHEEFNRRARALDAMVEGRRIHEIMEPFWPNAANDETLEPCLQEYGRIWTSARKYLVSNTRTAAEHNTTIVSGDDAIEQLANIRDKYDGAIGVGGANIATQLLERDLLDELLLFVHPAVLGSGRPLFDRLERPLELDLLEHQRVGTDVVMQRYSVRAQ